jgi:hypothetical protein
VEALCLACKQQQQLLLLHNTYIINPYSQLKHKTTSPNFTTPTTTSSSKRKQVLPSEQEQFVVRKYNLETMPIKNNLYKGSNKKIGNQVIQEMLCTGTMKKINTHDFRLVLQ